MYVGVYMYTHSYHIENKYIFEGRYKEGTLGSLSCDKKIGRKITMCLINTHSISYIGCSQDSGGDLTALSLKSPTTN